MTWGLIGLLILVGFLLWQIHRIISGWTSYSFIKKCRKCGALIADNDDSLICVNCGGKNYLWTSFDS